MPGATSAEVSVRPDEVQADCIDWVAQVLSIGFDGAADTDHDGLLDGWEANGSDGDGNGTYDVNIQSMGASVVHKDVFVEMDSMGAESVCPCHLPLAPDLDRIVAAFATSPYADNPDGRPGIAIHLDAGPYRGAKYDLGGGNVVAHDDDLNPVYGEFPPLKAANFSPLRAKTFHYMIWAHGYDGGRRAACRSASAPTASSSHSASGPTTARRTRRSARSSTSSATTSGSATAATT